MPPKLNSNMLVEAYRRKKVKQYQMKDFRNLACSSLYQLLFPIFFFLCVWGVKIVMVKSCIKNLPHLSYYTSKKGKIRRDLHPRFLSIFPNGQYLNCHPQGKKKKIFQHQFTRRPASQHKKKSSQVKPISSLIMYGSYQLILF